LAETLRCKTKVAGSILAALYPYGLFSLWQKWVQRVSPGG